MSDESARQRISVTQDRGVLVLRLNLPGDVESLEFDQLNEAVAEIINARIEAKWVLDLTGVLYAGSALLGLLVNIRTRVRRARGTLIVCQMDPMLERVLRTGSMDKLFVIVDTRDEAFEAF